METLARWLTRLESPSDPEAIRPYVLRLIAPGFEGLKLENFVIGATPLRALDKGLLSSSPEVLSHIVLLDTPEAVASLPDQQRRASDLAALFTLALERRVDIPPEITAKPPSADRIVFIPYQQSIDRSLLGPLPEEALQRIREYLSCVTALCEEDLKTIGAATSLHHGAALIFDRDPQAAYALLVAGIEVLSRAYGTPPTDWSEYEDAASWDSFFDELDLTPSQCGALRERMMEDRHLRLKATFRSYASERLPDTFWEKSWEEWMYVFRLNDEQWTTPVGPGGKRVQDVLSTDRGQVSKALGLSYNLRSGIVHRGSRVDLLDLISVPQGIAPADKALPFAVLRSILAELSRVELLERGVDGGLPNVQILKEPPRD